LQPVISKATVGLELHWIGKARPPQSGPCVFREDARRGYRARPKIKSGAIHDNLLIHGDNLPALTALAATHLGSVKCAYLDPPYNTGSAFAHYDDGVAHALWLSFMRDRLLLLRGLLRTDGSVWISIDDNEGHYLKVLCDEVFGRHNFIATVVWQKKYTQANDAEYFSDNHDFILVYARDRASFRMNGLPRSPKQNSAYRNPDQDARGPWKATPLHAKSGSNANFTFTFQNGVSWRPPSGTFPRFSPARLKEMDQTGQIWFGKVGTAPPCRKTFLSGVAAEVVPKSIWLYDEVGHNHEAREEAKAIRPADPFTTPKPERLLHRILTLATHPGDYVLDAFAGSGTTGAVAHKMGRRWIMVELGEHCDTHIVPRMRRVIDGDPGGVTEATGWQGGGGFRYYRLEPAGG
jgi:adenine-specific DNA-methyltransferase